MRWKTGNTEWVLSTERMLDILRRYASTVTSVTAAAQKHNYCLLTKSFINDVFRLFGTIPSTWAVEWPTVPITKANINIYASTAHRKYPTRWSICLLLKIKRTVKAAKVYPLYPRYRGNYQLARPYTSGQRCGQCRDACEDKLCSESQIELLRLHVQNVQINSGFYLSVLVPAANEKCLVCLWLASCAANPCLYRNKFDNCASLKNQWGCSREDVSSWCPASCQCTHHEIIWMSLPLRGLCASINVSSINTCHRVI